MLPADLVVLGALQGNGKTTLVRAQCDAWERQGVGVLYLPLEVDPAVCRLQWAAARQNLNMAAAVRQEWDRLPEGARECLEVELDHLQASPHLHFVPDKRVTLLSLRKWVEWGIRETKTRVVVVDHFHRLQFGGSAEAYRVAVTEAARQLKDLARDHGLTILATAQLNRSPDLLDAYQAPTIGRIKESAGLAEEADVVLMASRQLKPDLPAHIESQIRRGMASELDAADAGVLRLTCRKHRLDDSARDRFVRLYVEEGRVNGYATARFP
jgi:replicative DNA helicase